MIDIGVDLNRIRKDCFEVEGAEIDVTEDSEDGKAHLKVTFPSGYTYIKFSDKEENKSWLPFVDNQKCTDGIILQLDESNQVSIHLFELKTDLSTTQWNKVLKQFRGASLRALAFCRVVGYEVKDLFLYTCAVSCSIETFIEMQQQQEHVKGPARYKRPIGGNVKEATLWKEPEFPLFRNQPQSFKHTYIPLIHENDLNIGTYQI